MLVHHSGIRNYLFTALDATPELCTHLSQDISEEETDFRPDPARFSIREVVAHLADWDTIFLARIQQALSEDTPTIQDIDEGQRALDFDYVHSEPFKQNQLFHEHRAQISELVRALSPEQWERLCFHPRIGHISVEALVTIIPLHDAYHLRQISQWRQTFSVYKSVLD